MIFVTIGTHPQGFERLIKRIDEIAPKINEEIIIQRGFTKYIPKNCKSFEFEDLNPYFKKARLVICHSATSLLEFSLEYKKPVITVPRQAKYNEHINDHQVDFALFFANKTGIKAILDVNELTPQLLESYNSIPLIKKNNLTKLQSYFKDYFKKQSLPKPFAHNRIEYLVNLLEIKKEDKILNIGISNIPEVEMQIENKVKECVTIDFDKTKLEKASKFLKNTKLIQSDITKYKGFKDNYFDKIVVVEELEHLDDDYGA
jgi:UDP-N-acetylglucosamine transferase subunit ALG13